MLNKRVLERKEFRERENKYTKALDGYIFTIILDLLNLLDSYNETQVEYIY